MITESSVVQSPTSRSHSPVSITDFAPGIEAAFPSHFQEWDGRLECAVGQVPDFVRGTYYLNGPARFGMGNVRYRHWLDGDGMVSRLRFDRNGIHFKNRYVQSTKFVSEQEAGRALFRTFGTSFQGSRLNRVNNGLESPVNVSVYSFGERLLAFGEQGLPWELDPDSLETLGQFTFNARLNDASPMAAHPKFDAQTGEMYNFGIFFSSQNPRLYFYCFNDKGLRYRKAVSLPYSCSVHDFSLSRRYAIFFLSPYLLDIKNFLQSGGTVMESLHWEPARGSRLMVLDRSNGEMIASIAVGNRYCLHLINSFESEGRLIVDLLEFDAPIYGQYEPVPDFFPDVTPGGPVRFVINLESQELEQRLALDYLQAPDFPAIDPRLSMHPYDEFWMLGISATGNDGRKFFDQLVHANWNKSHDPDIYQCSPRCYLGGEPAFVGEPGSANGVVICQEFDARNRKSYFLVFDSRNIRQGAKTRIALDHILYLGFHAAFKPESRIP
ncbi:MAG TPA: carotenoid oxygenase family protein [Candidatus Angelobacter sp.]